MRVPPQRLLAKSLNAVKDESFVIVSMEDMLENINELSYRLHRARPVSAEMKMHLTDSFAIGIQM
jgi:hypothetical protein